MADKPDEPNDGGWTPLVAVFLAIGTFLLVLMLIVFGDMALSIGSLVYDIFTAEEQAMEIKRKHLPDNAKGEVRSAVRDALEASEEAGQQVIAENMETMVRAAWIDNDPERRDELADQVVRASWHRRLSSHDIDRMLVYAGAHDALRKRGADRPTTSWWEWALRRQEWNLIANADTGALRSSAKATCLAGDIDDSLAAFQAIVDAGSSLYGLEIADAIACGATAKLAETEFVRPSADVASIVAARELPGLKPLYDKLSEHKSSRRSLEAMKIAALLYLEDAVEAEEVIAKAKDRRVYCDRMERIVNEDIAPKRMFDAASKLERSGAGDAAERARAVETLRTVAIVSGLSRLEDVRPDGFEPEAPGNQLCLAEVETYFDAPAAIERLEQIIEQRGADATLLTKLAYAQAHEGNYEAAFESARRASTAASNDSDRGKANWMVIAMGHRTNRLDDVELADPRDQPIAVLQVLRGSDDEKQQARLHERPPVTFAPHVIAYYLQGALAPEGREQEFIDTLILPAASLSAGLWARAEAARWRGDTDRETELRETRRALHDRAAGGKNGGLRMLYRDI